MNKELKHFVINNETIENLTDDFYEVVKPIYWAGNIYGTYEEYEKSLERFSA